MSVAVRLSEEAYALSREILSKLLVLLDLDEERLPITAKLNLKSLKRVLNEIDKLLKELEIKHDINK